MEDSKKPSLDQVIKKLESLDIREWTWGYNGYGSRFTASIGSLKIAVFRCAKGIRNVNEIMISNRDERLHVEYYSTKNTVYNDRIAQFYNNLCEKYEEYNKKEFEETLEQVFSD